VEYIVLPTVKLYIVVAKSVSHIIVKKEVSMFFQVVVLGFHTAQSW